jgi:hypothetical protein
MRIRTAPLQSCGTRPVVSGRLVKFACAALVAGTLDSLEER